MSFEACGRWGDSKTDAPVEYLRELLATLDIKDDEHGDVSLIHETGWCLAAYPDGILTWENLDAGEPRHMIDVSREAVLALWLKLAAGEIAAVDAEPWLPGYEPPRTAEEQAEIIRRSEEITRAGQKEFWDALGPERDGVACRRPGCIRGAIHYSVFCRVHHFEALRGPCPFSD
jgi:hypothetical protein